MPTSCARSSIVANMFEIRHAPKAKHFHLAEFYCDQTLTRSTINSALLQNTTGYVLTHRRLKKRPVDVQRDCNPAAPQLTFRMTEMRRLSALASAAEDASIARLSFNRTRS